MQKVINLGRLELTSRVMNAAGPWSSSKKQLVSLHRSNIGAVVTKTFTLQATAGNEEPNSYFDSSFSINSVGLANKGAKYFISARKELGDKKPVIASISEKTPEDLLVLARLVQRSGFNAMELNLSCPNVITKEPVAYDARQLDTLLRVVFKGIRIPVAVKLPPYVTRGHMTKITQVLAKYPINHLVVINTYPFATAFISELPAIKPNKGIGGLGGNFLKPIALAHVVLFKEYLPDIPIVAVGGINNIHDIEDFITAGATAVQIGTAIETHGVTLLDKLARQLVA